jgi:YgiT-type zinc finger domain-containing protein
MNDDAPRTCSSCRIGTLRRKAATYAAWHGDQFVVVPSTPVWTCDVCGERTYDQGVIDHLPLLVGQESPLPDADRAAGAHHKSDRAPADETTRSRRRA